MPVWMVVEDEPDLYTMLLAIYEIIGVKDVSFTNGEDAINWIDSVDRDEYTRELPELALLDIRLPGEVDGSLVAHRIRQSPKLHNMATILITAYKLSPGQENDIMEFSGADDLMYKPLPEVKALRKHLTKILLAKNPR